MNPLPGGYGPHRWPERYAWTSAAIGVVGLLLLALMLFVDGLEPAQDSYAVVSRGEATAAPIDAHPPVAVHVESVAAGPLVQTLILPGVVEAGARVELAFRVGGQIAALHVEVGDPVEAGALIAELDSADLEREVGLAEAALARARAEYRDAEARLGRSRQLHAVASTSQERFEQAQLAVAVLAAQETEAELRLGNARARRDHAQLRAPISGVIERRTVEAHEVVESGEVAFVISQLDYVVVRASVSDRLLPRLREGAGVRVRSAAWPEREFHGRIARLEVAVDRATRSVPFEIELDNEDGALVPELAVEVELRMRVGVDTPTLPLAAVLRDAELEPFCFVVAGSTRADGEPGAWTAVRRPLELGEIVDDRVQVAKGLEEGEQVVIRGQHFVHAGDSIALALD